MPQDQEVVMWACDDFLAASAGIAEENSVAAAMTMGAGAGGTRNIAGNSPVHLMMEQKAADFHGRDAGLLVTTRHVAHEAAVTTLAELLPECGIFLQGSASPTIREAARRSREEVHYFDEPQQLRDMLTTTTHASRLVVIESISATGCIEPVQAYREVCQEGGGLLLVDESRATGVYGATGAGIMEAGGVAPDGTILIGCLDGTLGGLMMGGYIVGQSDHIDCIRSFASSFIFTTAVPPAVIQCAASCMDQAKQNSTGRAAFSEQVVHLRERLQGAGVPLVQPSTQQATSHLLCVPLASPAACHAAAEALLEYGLLVQALTPPDVPESWPMGLRINTTLAHDEAMLDDLEHGLKQVSKQLQLW